MTFLSGPNEVVQYLVEKGANIHLRNNADWTPLMIASHDGCLTSFYHYSEKNIILTNQQFFRFQRIRQIINRKRCRDQLKTK